MDSLLGFSFDTESLLHDPEETGTAFGIGGVFEVECYGPDGKLKWREIAKNIIPNSMLDNILNVYFNAGSVTTTFYLGMVDNAAFSAFAATDTMASHAGWVENTNCSNATRPTWTPSAASSQAIANPTQVTFTMNPGSPVTIKGFFMTSNNTLGGTSGNLVATAALATPQAASNGDTLKVTYTISATTT